MGRTLITDEEKDLIEKELGNRLKNDAFGAYKEAAVVATTQDALAALLEGFDAFCQDSSIKYFLFSDSLQGALAYGDFVPEKKSVQLGMLFAEFDKLQQSASKVTQEYFKNDVPWHLSFIQDGSSYVRRRFPRIESDICFPVRINGDDVFDDTSLPLEVEHPFIEISIFTAIPDDFLTKRSFFRRMKRRNYVFEKTNKARKAIAKSKSSIFSSNLLFALIPRRITVATIFHCSKRYEGKGMSSVARLFGQRTKTVSLEALGKCRRAIFHGVEVWIPEHQTSWAAEPMNEPSPELCALQNNVLEIVSEIHRVCDVLGIGYFACGGTMLGYVRHSGFIPWDDDIDVGMLREDYEIFKERAPAVIDVDRFFVQTRESDPNIPYLFTKVRMNGTSYITEYNQFRDFHKGICVDVFPFDSIPNGRSGQEKFKDEVRKVEARHNSVVNRQHPKGLLNASHGAHSLDYVAAHAVGKMLASLYWNVSLVDTQVTFDSVVRKYNAKAAADNLEYVACFVPSYTMVKRKDLLPYCEVDFEGRRINVPARPEVFLKMQYGDYNEMPLLHQRVGHDLIEFGDVTAGR